MIEQIENSLWVEKYRPKTLSEYVCSDKIRNKLQTYIENNDVPHLVLASGPGRGKTSLAKMLCNELKAKMLYINCPDESSVDIIREKVKRFASSATSSSIKVVVLDEANGLTPSAQETLKGIIEFYSKNTRFIFTTNHIDKIDPAIISRCRRISMEEFTKEQAYSWLSTILDKEGIEYDEKTLKFVISLHHPDLRKLLDSVQDMIVDGKLTGDDDRVKLVNLSTFLFNTLRENSSKSVKWQKIYDYLINNSITDYDLIYKIIFSRITAFNEEIRPSITLILADWLKWNPTTPDRFINTMAMISQLLDCLHS